MALNPSTNTRREFVEALQAQPVPSNATPGFRKLWEDTNELAKKLAYHEAMEPNLDRVYMEPARRRSKVYFMWDFVSRTRAIMQDVNPSNPSRSRGDSFSDVVGRSTMTSMLIDDEDRKIDMMTNEPGDDELQFGPEIIELAKQVGRDAGDL
ncbi:hypothetical protein BDZ85DRAFT_261080 [Elsinoe ampelina]|uniref:Uncharacterized protein n=1 Tax=Elsinoe ampelina TaxID=302913 RepID=A0A6A6GG66_9PEZI|nr:hypothetical protein BDZ85DRAFT_261080 [Elsinoe ampelina]